MNRVQPLHRFIQMISKLPTEDLLEEYYIKKQDILFYEFDLLGFENLSHPKAQKIMAWKKEFEEDNEIILRLLEWRIFFDFELYLAEFVNSILGEVSYGFR